MRCEVWEMRYKSFQDWSLLYMAIDELINKETILIWIFQETHWHFAQRVWYLYNMCLYLLTFLVLISLKIQIILSIKNGEYMDHWMVSVCLFKPSSTPFWTSLNVSFCLLPPQKPQSVQEVHYCLLQMCREVKMISKISMLPAFSGHWKSHCTVSDNYAFPISVLAWIFPAFTNVEVLHTSCSQISRPPMNALQMLLYVQTS